VSDTVLETISPVLITKVVTRWDKALVPSNLSPAASWERTCDSSERVLAVVYGYNDGRNKCTDQRRSGIPNVRTVHAKLPSSSRGLSGSHSSSKRLIKRDLNFA
jgi:hypothetical protein